MAAISGKPAYERVADDLRRKITDGTYSVGDALPSTQALMSSYEVSSTVARRAISELRNEGLVLGQPGKAVYVKAEPAAAQEPERSPEYEALMQRLEALRVDLDSTLTAIDGRLRKLEEIERRRK